MKCVRCIIDVQETGKLGGDEPKFHTTHGEAILVYKGDSLCIQHFNMVRGQAPLYMVEGLNADMILGDLQISAQGSDESGRYPGHDS